MPQPDSPPMRCLLVRPPFLKDTFYSLDEMLEIMGAGWAAPPLGLLIVAALLPEHWELRLVDAAIEPLDDAELRWADIVMISGKGPQEQMTLEVIRRAHALDTPVVVGGPGPTLQPQVYEGVADYVVCGEAEVTLPLLLADLARGVPSGVYRSSELADLRRDVLPRFDLTKLDRYLFVGVAYSRGCPFSCEFCAQIEIFGHETRTESPEQVLRQLQTLYDLGYRGMIDFGYDNLIGDIPAAEVVLEAMARWSKRHDYPFFYSTEATVNLARQPRILELMRENDFRYVFCGIESGDNDVLDRTRKGQNTAMPVEEAVRVINAHGMIVYTGLILGFDGETSDSAHHMLDMVQRTGAFPALVLPLHALPGTRLSARLREEGRLYSGHIMMNRSDRTDTATTGLNFVTDRPRVEILRDLAGVLEQLYAPENHYARLALTLEQLRPALKHKPPLRVMLKQARAFIKIVRSIGLDRRSGALFFRMLASVVLKNRRAFELAVGLALMNQNYGNQARSYVRALRQQADEVESMGEDVYDRMMLGQSSVGAVPCAVPDAPC